MMGDLVQWVVVERRSPLMDMGRQKQTLLSIHQRQDLCCRGLIKEMTVGLTARLAHLGLRNSDSNRRTEETGNRIDQKNKLILCPYDTFQFEYRWLVRLVLILFIYLFLTVI